MLGVWNDLRTPVQGKHINIVFIQLSLGNRLAHKPGPFRNIDFADTVASADRQPLAHIDLGEIHLRSNIFNHRTRHIEAGAGFDTLEPRRGVHFENLRASTAFQHIHPRHLQPHNLGGSHGGVDILLRQVHGLRYTTAVHITAKFLPLRHSAHGGHHPVAHHKRADILALALGNKFLDQHILFLRLQQLDDGFRLFNSVGQQDADTLGPFNQFDHHRRPAHALNRRQYVFFVVHKGGPGNADVMPAE